MNNIQLSVPKPVQPKGEKRVPGLPLPDTRYWMQPTAPQRSK